MYPTQDRSRDIQNGGKSLSGSLLSEVLWALCRLGGPVGYPSAGPSDGSPLQLREQRMYEQFMLSGRQ